MEIVHFTKVLLGAFSQRLFYLVLSAIMRFQSQPAVEPQFSLGVEPVRRLHQGYQQG